MAIIAGVFFAVLVYLEQQEIVNVNWDKLQGALSAIVNSTASGGVGGNHTAASSLLPTTTMMTNLSIPLTGSMATGFAIGILKG